MMDLIERVRVDGLVRISTLHGVFYFKLIGTPIYINMHVNIAVAARLCLDEDRVFLILLAMCDA